MIYVENDNWTYNKGKIRAEDIEIKQYGNFEAGFSATIENCKFSDSSFAYGMIYVPPNIDAYFASAPLLMGTHYDNV